MTIMGNEPTGRSNNTVATNFSLCWSCLNHDILDSDIMTQEYRALVQELCGTTAFRRFFCHLHHGENRPRHFSFAPWQLARLEAIFAECRYPDLYRREDLAIELQINESRIREWFVERGMEWRRRSIRIEPAKIAG